MKIKPVYMIRFTHVLTSKYHRQWMSALLVCLSLIFTLLTPNAFSANRAMIQDFETKKAFKGKLKGATRIRHGKDVYHGSKYAALWDSKRYNGITIFPPVKDWTPYKSIQFSLKVSEANSQPVALVIYSQNPATNGDDSYRYRLKADWVGWKTFRVPFDKLEEEGIPIGLEKVSQIKVRTYRFPKKVGLPQKFMVDDVVLYK